MYLNNSFNILPWYDSLAKRSSQKWYAFGQSWPLLCPKGRILPFQFVCEKIEILSTVFAVDVKTGAATDLKVTPTVVPSTQADATYYVVKMPSTQVIELPVGLYYLRFNTSLGYLYSEEISIIDDAEECVKIEYWNEDTLKFTSGEINFEDNFKFELYLRTTIGKPEYEFEEELTKRLGYKFIESQTSNKLYKFAFVAPEYICDAMRLIRLCDYIKITTKFDSYNALSFAYEPKWQEQGDLAAVDAEFDTDCIIQKLESFNRRLRESFYNALLAEIDEPVLFSTDTVAQYYAEFTSTSYINGKLIRQLDSMPISELRDSLADIVLPADNQSDNRQAAKKVFLSDILSLVETISNYFKPHYSGDGQLEWIEALAHIGVRGGVTMYIDGGNLNLPSIYDGLPIDWKTLIRDTNGVLMVNPDIELGGGITTWDELQGKPAWIGSSKPVYNYSEIQGTPDLSNYALSSDVAAVSSKLNDFLEGSDTDNIINKWKELESFLTGLSQSDNLATILGNKAEKTDLAKYIPIAGATDITGEKNFVGGLKVNGSPIYYDTEKKYWKLEGDLLVTGGVAMYGNDSDFVASTIMDAILYDDSTLGINAQGQLYVKGGTGGGTVSGDYLPLVGGTLYGALNLSDNVWNNIGVNSAIGSIGAYKGQLSIKSVSNNSPGIAFFNSSATHLGSLQCSEGILYWRDNIVLNTNNYSSYALPLTGGTLSGDLLFDNINHNRIIMSRGGNYAAIGNNYNKLLFEFKYATYSTYHGLMIDEYGLNYTLRTENSTIEKYKVWNEYNDGSDSGLDADLLDGKHYSDIINGNVASSTKLQTSRTIWGQSFDGTGNVGGILALGASYITGNGGANILDSQGDWVILGSGNHSKKWTTYIDGYKVNFRYGDNANSAMYIDESGKVGIATQTPICSLDVVGEYHCFNISSSSSNGAVLTASLGTSKSQFGYWNTGNRATILYDYESGGFIKIRSEKVNNVNLIEFPETTYLGTADIYNQIILSKHHTIIGYGNIASSIPTYIDGYELYLRYGENWKYLIHCKQNGNFHVPGVVTFGYINKFNNSTEYAGYIGRGSTDGRIILYSKDDVYMYADGVLNTKLDGTNLLCYGGVTMYSDIRKKTKLKDVVLSLQQVANAPLIEHYYNSDQNKTTHVGSIAQYWADMNDWFCKKDSEGYYTMEIQNAALASAISVARELVKFETETDRRIRLLEEENKRLKEEVECLKLNIA